MHLTTLLTTNFKVDFFFEAPFFVFIIFTSTTPFRSEYALSECTRDVSLLVYDFILLLFFSWVCLSFSLQAQCDINSFKFMEKTKWCLLNKNKVEYNKN